MCLRILDYFIHKKGTLREKNLKVQRLERTLATHFKIYAPSNLLNIFINLTLNTLTNEFYVVTIKINNKIKFNQPILIIEI